MSLASRLTCSSLTSVTRKLVLRPLPQVVLQSVRHKFTGPSDDPTDVRSRIGKFINKDKKEKAVQRDEINPADPHEGFGLGDFFVGPGLKRKATPPKTAEDFRNPNPKLWVSYGFDIWNQREDRIEMHIYFFIYITIVIYGTGAFIYYLPDVRLDSWSNREAYIEMERRKKLGGPYVSRDYVPADLVKLPSDEELGDAEIII